MFFTSLLFASKMPLLFRINMLRHFLCHRDDKAWVSMCLQCYKLKLAPLLILVKVCTGPPIRMLVECDGHFNFSEESAPSTIFNICCIAAHADNLLIG